MPYDPHAFKYLLVVDGLTATSGRLADLLAHSGAVILLQESLYQYHFSNALKPWVHYVPITYNTADLIEKVEWLKAHDDLAQKLAINAANFGNLICDWKITICAKFSGCSAGEIGCSGAVQRHANAFCII